MLAQVVLSGRQHSAGTARRVVDRLDDVSLAQVGLRRQQQIHHQPDHLAGREVLPSLLVGLLCTDPDELLEDVAHLHVVDPSQRQIEVCELLDDLEQQVAFVHTGDVLTEAEAFHDLAHVLREADDVGVEVLRELVRVVEQPLEVQRRRVVERPSRGVLKELPSHVVALCAVLSVCVEHRLFRVGENAVEAAQHRQRQDDLAVLVTLVRTTQQVADPPDEPG